MNCSKRCGRGDERPRIACPAYHHGPGPRRRGVRAVPPGDLSRHGCRAHRRVADRRGHLWRTPARGGRGRARAGHETRARQPGRLQNPARPDRPDPPGRRADLDVSRRPDRRPGGAPGRRQGHCLGHPQFRRASGTQQPFGPAGAARVRAAVRQRAQGDRVRRAERGAPPRRKRLPARPPGGDTQRLRPVALRAGSAGAHASAGPVGIIRGRARDRLRGAMGSAQGPCQSAARRGRAGARRPRCRAALRADRPGHDCGQRGARRSARQAGPARPRRAERPQR
ncbi:hypothetical protein D3C72_1184330 [compost metagenome]